MLENRDDLFEKPVDAFVVKEVEDIIAKNVKTDSEYFVDLGPLDMVEIIPKNSGSSDEVIVHIENYGEALMKKDSLFPIKNLDKDRAYLKEELDL
ncbi:hypothetical protein ACG2F4_05045 [Halalkalibaculum sp. DA3122]|uniref:hypothetical protein n=1 Tax=Halalkalibaculum sp. DA3122 TaxID=3373607 RepID=UPI0037549FE2